MYPPITHFTQFLVMSIKVFVDNKQYGKRGLHSFGKEKGMGESLMNKQLQESDEFAITYEERQ